MKLFFRKYGSGQPLIILHGLFGQSDNWNTLAKQFGDGSSSLTTGFEVYAVDLRNHGLSPWSDEWNYKAMSEDILELIEENDLKDAILLGHSLGGKVAMQFAMDHPGKLSKLIVADIAPKKYPGNNDTALEGLLSVDLSKINSRKEAQEQLAKHIADTGTQQFLLKNLYRTDEGRYDWRFNLSVIAKNYSESGAAVMGTPSNIPALFIRGGRSNYILEKDSSEIKKLFPNTTFATVKDSGHWVHADKPKEFFEEVMKFIR